jgi:hypothetical protein
MRSKGMLTNRSRPFCYNEFVAMAEEVQKEVSAKDQVDALGRQDLSEFKELLTYITKNNPEMLDAVESLRYLLIHGVLMASKGIPLTSLPLVFD